jgi:hypothetical protein
MGDFVGFIGVFMGGAVWRVFAEKLRFSEWVEVPISWVIFRI